MGNEHIGADGGRRENDDRGDGLELLFEWRLVISRVCRLVMQRWLYYHRLDDTRM